MPDGIDLNKIYEPMREGMSLAQLAGEINKIIAAEEDMQLGLALRLVQAKRLVEAREGTNLSWGEWCASNVRKRNGEPYAKSSIEWLLSIGRNANPAQKLKEARERDAMHNERGVRRGQVGHSSIAAAKAHAQSEVDEVLAARNAGLTQVEIAQKIGRSQATVSRILRGLTKTSEFYTSRAREETIAAQIAQLDASWEAAQPEARRQWMHGHNLRVFEP